MANSLKIKLVRSCMAAVKKDQTATCHALGLRRIGDVVVQRSEEHTSEPVTG